MKKQNWKLHFDTVVDFGDGGIDLQGAPDPKNRARLIASAPALLEALDGLYKMVQENYHVDDSNMKFINNAYAAIASAKGE